MESEQALIVPRQLDAEGLPDTAIRRPRVLRGELDRRESSCFLGLRQIYVTVASRG